MSIYFPSVKNVKETIKQWTTQMFPSSYNISNTSELISSSQKRLAVWYWIKALSFRGQSVDSVEKKEHTYRYYSRQFRVSYGCIYAVGAQFRRAMCKYGHVIGQQYTRGTRIIIAVSTTTPFTPQGLFRRYSMAVRRVNYC